jgi:hypothetical protein
MAYEYAVVSGITLLFQLIGLLLVSLLIINRPYPAANHINISSSMK